MSTPAKILIIEDSSYLAESLIDMLQMFGYEPIHAPTGTLGVQLALSTQPDLILLDIRLPDVNGYDVYRQIRTTEWGKTAKIIVLTASESIDNIAKNIDLPREYVMFKPDSSVHAIINRIQDRLAETT